jgi:hypothetical protein
LPSRAIGNIHWSWLKVSEQVWSKLYFSVNMIVYHHIHLGGCFQVCRIQCHVYYSAYKISYIWCESSQNIGSKDFIVPFINTAKSHCLKSSICKRFKLCNIMYLIDEVSIWHVFRNAFSLSMRLWKQCETLSKSIHYSG